MKQADMRKILDVPLKEGLQTTFVNLLECIIYASVISANDHTMRKKPL